MEDSYYNSDIILFHGHARFTGPSILG